MGTKEEIDKFLKDLQLNPKYIVFNFNEGFQYDLEDIIQRALNHFKPKPVASKEKLKEIREMIKYILPTPDCNDSEIVETYTETIMSIFSQDKTVISNIEIEREIQHIFDSGANEIRIFDLIKRIQSKLYTTVTDTTDNLLSSDENKKRLKKSIKQIEELEPKKDCICSGGEICAISFNLEDLIEFANSVSFDGADKEDLIMFLNDRQLNPKDK